MSDMRKISSIIQRMPAGKLVSYDQFPSSVSKTSLSQCLSRLNKKGLLVRLEPGKYYKPEKTKFGNLKPSESELLKSVTGYLGKTAYLSGLALYQQEGLTTQVPNELLVIGNGSTRKKRINNLTIKYQKGSIKIESENIKLYQTLDLLKYIKKAPDINPDRVVLRVKEKIKSLTDKEKSRLVKIAIDYPPTVRALCGSIMEDTGEKGADKLFQSLNPLSTYKVPITSKVLSNKEKWKIK